MRSFIVFAVLLVSTPAKAQGLEWQYKVGLVGANLFDAASTRVVLESNKNAKELNHFVVPFADSTPKLLVFKGGLGLLEVLIVTKIAKEHPKAARVVSVIGIAIPSVAGLSNLRKLQ